MALIQPIFRCICIGFFEGYKKVMGKFMNRQPNGKQQTREPPKENFDSA